MTKKEGVILKLFNPDTSFPDAYDVLIGESNVNSVTWYDDYSFPGSTAYSFGSFSLAGYTVPQSAKIKGQITGTLTRVLVNYDAVTDDLLLSVSYYDDFGRPTRIISDNHLGGKDVVYTNYNFSGQVTRTTTVHNHGQGNQVMLATTYAYDHQGRVTTEKLKINQQNEITLAAYKYNKLGEQVARYLHGSSSGDDFNQQIDYTYNEKGWMRQMNTVNNLGRDLFALDLRYNTPGSSDALTAGARYNGNISEMRWNAGTPKGYGFTYDGLNRLTAADYAEGSSFTGNADYYNTSYTYDKNGNIDLLNRYRGAKIDGLDYAYHSNEKSNQLLSVTDAGTTAGYRAAGGSYLYDANGNLTTDPSKGTTIEYNPLNLPERVTFDLDDEIRYTYDAAGNKRIKVVDGINAENNTRIDYSANFLYENNDLKAIFTSAGRIVPFNNNGEVLYKYEYNLQDHLGNTRVVFGGHSNGQPEVMQVTDYYPFGLVMNQQNYFADGVLDNMYLYNGKELQDDELAGNSLGWYDYGARFYNAELGRWHSVDPLAEQYESFSPYNYAANNPILLIDPDGMRISPYYDEKGNIIGVDEHGFKGNIYITDAETFNKNSSNGIASSKDIQASSNTKVLQESNLSAEGFSKVYSHVLQKGGYDMSKVAGESVAVKGPEDSFNNPSENVKYILTTSVGQQPFKISVNQTAEDVKVELTTVENIQNSLGAHEYTGHGIEGFSTYQRNHYKAYENQINHQTWSNTTSRFQTRIMSRYADLLRVENPNLYRQKYPEIIKYWGK